MSFADAGLYTREEGSWEIGRNKLQIHVSIDVPRRPWLETEPSPGKEVREFGPEQKAEYRYGASHCDDPRTRVDYRLASTSVRSLFTDVPTTCVFAQNQNAGEI
jgi:hypothetical protein